MLKFVPYDVRVDIPFWRSLGIHKTDTLKLDESEQLIVCSYGSPTHRDNMITFNSSSIDGSSDPNSSKKHQIYGTIKVMNTLDSFKKLQRGKMFTDSGLKLLESIKEKDFLDIPSSLVSTFMLSYVDLKKHRYIYYLGFPTLQLPEAAQYLSVSCINACYNDKEMDTIKNNYQELGKQEFFLVKGTKLYHLSYLKDYKGSLSDFTFAYLDSSAGKMYPGWTLRNYLYALACTYDLKEVKILAFRGNFETGHYLEQSKIYLLSLPTIPKDYIPQVIGWNTVSENKISPKIVNLSKILDEKAIAQQSVNLNLKLMRWRHIPTFDLDQVAKTKCLLIGAGTLGSHVAHNLIAWGFRDITFVDNGTVSYSNLTRQTLYSFADNDKKKAITAAKRLKEIYPEIKSEGIDIDIPMPGHSISEAEADTVVQNIVKLDECIQEADVVFILLDSRESRWLPTLLCSAGKKLCYNVAIGFSTYSCLRHGLVNKDVENADTSCYFCSDLASPADSLTDATVDMKCTVTRPGVSMMASSIVTEMFMNRFNKMEQTPPISQVRGEVDTYNNVSTNLPPSDNCVACSYYICKEYKEKGLEFLFKVFNKPDYLEEVSGIKELKSKVDDLEVLAYDSGSDSEVEGDSGDDPYPDSGLEFDEVELSKSSNMLMPYSVYKNIVSGIKELKSKVDDLEVLAYDSGSDSEVEGDSGDDPYPDSGSEFDEVELSKSSNMLMPYIV